MATRTSERKSKTKAEVNVLNVAYVWDMSGSMGIVEEATKEGTAQYLLDLQAEESKLAKRSKKIFTRLSLTIFDTVFEPWIVNEPIAEVDVREIVARYHHRGSTALYDAIAHTITEIEARLRNEEREQEKVLVIVMTDGQENSSQDYSLRSGGRQRIFDLIKHYEAKGNWTFVYLGANVDAYTEAANIGIPQGNAAYYSPSYGSTASVASSLSSVTSTRRAGPTGQTVTAFADAGQSQDYRDDSDATSGPGEAKVWNEHEQRFVDISKASSQSRSAR